MYNYGKILKRTKFEPNEIHIKDGYAIMDLYNSKNTKVSECLIDIDDIDIVKSRKWTVNADGYVFTYEYDNNNKIHRKTMHRILMNPKDNELVDHINLNKKDNRRSNLRIVNGSQNEMNKTFRSNNTSGKTGVWYDKKSNKWVAEIMIHKKKIYLGIFVDFNDAVKERRNAEIRYFGEYRCDIS